MESPVFIARRTRNCCNRRHESKSTNPIVCISKADFPVAKTTDINGGIAAPARPHPAARFRDIRGYRRQLFSAVLHRKRSRRTLWRGRIIGNRRPHASGIIIPGAVPRKREVGRNETKVVDLAKSNKGKSGKSSGKDNPNEKVISENRRARHEYLILDSLECGIVLVGSEVKSCRAGQVSLAEAYGRIKGDEVWLIGADIAEYREANQFNHEARRPRKLLLHRREIKKFAGKALQQGLTLVPLRMYFKEGRAKVLMGVCKGQKEYDKREAMKKAEAKRAIARHMQKRL